MTDANIAPPQGGWTLLEAGAFEKLTGPLFTTKEGLGPDEPIRIGFRVEPRHCNASQFCHGGMIATFLDMALGLTINRGIKADGDSATMGMSIDFLRAALPGDWIESRSRLLHSTYRTGFCETLAVGPNGPVARGSGIFRLARAKKT